MEWYLLFAAVVLPILLGADPAPNLVHAKTRSRNMDCERLSAEAGSERFPGQVAPARPRADDPARSVVVCRERLMRPGLRSTRDEAILSRLDELCGGLAAAVADLRPDLARRTWLVEAHYPSAPVASKIAFATKNALVARGFGVTDRTPVLGGDDIGVITRLPPEQAYAAACVRYRDTGALGPGDALLAVASRDPRETVLHAGLCDAGQWMWLQ